MALPPKKNKKSQIQENPESFTPENGAWGRAGSTKVRLDLIDEEVLGEAMTLAWRKAKRTQR